MNNYPSVRRDCCWMNFTCVRNATPHAQRTPIKPSSPLEHKWAACEPRCLDQKCLLLQTARGCVPSSPTYPWGHTPSSTKPPSKHRTGEQPCPRPRARPQVPQCVGLAEHAPRSASSLSRCPFHAPGPPLLLATQR